MYKPKVVMYTMNFVHAPANDGTTDTRDIKTNYTSRTDMIKFKLHQMKEALMEFFDEYDFDRLLADALVLFAVLISGAFMVYFVLENYGGM